MKASQKQIEKILDEAKEVAEELECSYECFGLRVIPEGYTVGSGDILNPSYNWDDGENTGELLAGTSAIELIGDYSNNLVQYCGAQIALIAGDDAGYGEDCGEILIDNAEVLKTWNVKRGNKMTEIKINKIEGDVLYYRYPAQTGSQPCVVDFDLETGEITADWLTESNVVPLSVYHGRVLRFDLPEALPTELITDVLEGLLDEFCTILEDSEIVVDDQCNRVGSLGDDAERAAAAIQRYLNDLHALQLCVCSPEDYIVSPIRPDKGDTITSLAEYFRTEAIGSNRYYIDEADCTLEDVIRDQLEEQDEGRNAFEGLLD
jgi:hypothetical protein